MGGGGGGTVPPPAGGAEGRRTSAHSGGGDPGESHQLVAAVRRAKHVRASGRCDGPVAVVHHPLDGVEQGVELERLRERRGSSERLRRLEKATVGGEHYHRNVRHLWI